MNEQPKELTLTLNREFNVPLVIFPANWTGADVAQWMEVVRKDLKIEPERWSGLSENHYTVFLT